MKTLVKFLGIFLVVFAGISSASTVLTISNPNPALAPFPGPYATITITLTDSTHAAVEADSLTNGSNDYLIGGEGAFGLNVSSLFTIGPVTEFNSLGSPFTPTFKSCGSGTESGFGVFNLSCDNSDGFGDSATKINFTLTDTSGTWATSDAVITPNAGGYSGVAHLFDRNPSCDGACVTGFAANGGTPPQVPEPVSFSLAIIGGGMMGLGLIARRRK